MEKETIERNKEENGEILNYDRSVLGNKVILTNENGELYPSAVFVKTLGNNKNMEIAQKAEVLSKQLGIPCIEIDKCLCRERLGLDPLTEKEEKDLKADKSL